MSFFIFSMQVHEKQILSPLLIMWLVPGDFGPLLTWGTILANFSMYKLYVDDYNIISYIAGMATLSTLGFAYEGWVVPLNLSSILRGTTIANKEHPSCAESLVSVTLWLRSLLVFGLFLSISVYHVAEYVKPVPVPKLPDLYLVANNAFSLLCFFGLYAYGHLMMVCPGIKSKKKVETVVEPTKKTQKNKKHKSQ